MLSEKDTIFIAGHQGLIGSSLVKIFQSNGYNNLILKKHSELDLCNTIQTELFLKKNKPNIIIIAAGMVGGIQDNIKEPAKYLNVNLKIQNNIIFSNNLESTHTVIYFGSSCIYPKNIKKKIREEDMLNGKPEETSLAYATAKLCGIQSCLSLNKQLGIKKFIPIIPCTVFGPNDNYELNSGHVISDLINKFQIAKDQGAKEISLWGTGKPKREFIFSEILAEAILFILKNKDKVTSLPLNIGNNKEYSIKKLANIIKKITSFSGKLLWDTTKPDGARRKLLDSSKINYLGWEDESDFINCLQKTYDFYLKEIKNKKSL